MAGTAQTVEIKVQGHILTLETGRLARQASGAVLARMGDNVVLATVTGSPAPRVGIDFFPLMVEYREKLAAAGRIPGNYQRREGRITDHEILVSRLIDRTLRSLFPDGYRCEVQVQVTVLSAVPGADVQSLGLLAAGCALHLSPLPASGPAAGLRIAAHQGRMLAFPTLEQRAEAAVDFVVSTGPQGLVMVEGEADEAPEQLCLAALEQALAWAGKCRAAFEELRSGAGVEKLPAPETPTLPDPPPDVLAALERALTIPGKQERNDEIIAVRARWLAGSGDDEEQSLREKAFGRTRYECTRNLLLQTRRRLDGRGPEDIRPIWSEAAWLPRAHGSAVFTRGETQALVTCTLGSTDNAQRLEGLAGEYRERFLLHYNFPPYSVGEVRPLRGPGRREIGHGNLARRGLLPVFPDEAAFPYTVRVEAEISESNGSSSMATVCGACLAMMDAGVPLKRPVAGIAMGLVTDGQRTAILSDILGDEDHLGDMDFKVVGTAVGVTALQLDNKLGGLAFETLASALEQARQGRLHILERMAETLQAPRDQLSRFAPRVERTAIMPSSIGALVGPRGANIRAIQESTGARIAVDDDGVVLVYAPEGPAAQRAMTLVQQAAGILQAGHCYRGTVTGIKDFGVFVRVNGVNEGLVPIEELDRERVKSPRDLCQEGDKMIVQVLGADDRGRLRLSRKAALGVDDDELVF